MTFQDSQKGTESAEYVCDNCYKDLMLADDDELAMIGFCSESCLKEFQEM